MDQERRPQSSLTVNLLSRESGRPHLAKIAQDLALAQAAGVLKPSRLANGIIEETIDGESHGMIIELY
jgi:undecaprenyl pyrophosphate synthase